MKNNWTNEFETKCYVVVPKHGTVNLKPYVCGVYFYEPMLGHKRQQKILLDLDAPRPDTTKWQSDDPDMIAIYDQLHNPIVSNIPKICKLKPPLKKEVSAYLSKIKMGDAIVLNKAQIRLVQLEWCISN